MKIEDLNINEKEKSVLKELETPKTIAETAAILDTSYSTAFTKLAVWQAKGWVKKQVLGRAKKYHLNQDELELQ